MHRRLEEHANPIVLATGFIRRILLLSLIALVTGCSVNQKQEVASYRKVLDANSPAASELKPGQLLTLEQAFVLANRHNENLGLSGEQYLQALVEKNRVLANFLPTVSFQPNYSIEQAPKNHGSGGMGPTLTGFGLSSPVPGGSNTAGLSGITEGTGNQTVSNGVAQRFEAPVVGNINLFRGFADIANVKIANLLIDEQKQLLLNTQATILLNVAQAYYQVLRSERQVDVLQHTLELQRARVTDMENHVLNGLARQLDLAQSRADEAATRVALVQAQSDVRNGRSVLAFLIGVKAVDGPLDDTFAVPIDPGPEPAYEELALATRQDLRADIAAVAAARHAVDVAVAEYYPTVQLNVSGFLYRESFSDSTKWDAILSANLPVFSAGLIEADVRDAWSNLRIAALAESLLHRQICQDVQIAYENLATSERRITELRNEVTAANDAFNQSRDAYAAGLARNLDVLTFEDQLLDAQLQLASAAFDRTVFYLDLVRATGQLTTRFPAQRTLAATTLPADRIANNLSPMTTRPTTLPTPLPYNLPVLPPATQP